MSYTESTLRVGFNYACLYHAIHHRYHNRENGHDNRNYDIQDEEQGTTLDNKTTHLTN